MQEVRSDRITFVHSRDASSRQQLRVTLPPDIPGRPPQEPTLRLSALPEPLFKNTACGYSWSWTPILKTDSREAFGNRSRYVGWHVFELRGTSGFTGDGEYPWTRCTKVSATRPCKRDSNKNLRRCAHD